MLSGIAVQLLVDGALKPWRQWQHFLHQRRRRVYHKNRATQGGRLSAETSAWILHGNRPHLATHTFTVSIA